MLPRVIILVIAANEKTFAADRAHVAKLVQVEAEKQTRIKKGGE